MFWHSNPKKIKPFKQAYQNKIDAENYNAWLSGSYIRVAICSALSKNTKYPDKPFGVTELRETTMQSSEIAANKFDAWTKVYNEKFEKNTMM